AHGADDLKVLQRACSGRLVGERLLEHSDIDAVADFRPIGHLQGEVKIVVRDCTAQPRHGEVRSWQGMTGRKTLSGRAAMVARNRASRKRAGRMDRVQKSEVDRRL